MLLSMSRTDSPSVRELEVAVDDTIGKVSALLMRPRGARWLYVLGHGAGAGMRHPFMEAISARLARRKVATFRYQFPYMEAGRKRPDQRNRLQATVRAAIRAAAETGRIPLIAGGKSMGGRMTSMCLAERPEDSVRALAFLGFPLHPAGRAGTGRAEHLGAIDLPMLFLQGTRDKLADLDLMRPVCKSLGERVRLHVVAGGDHSFKVLKRSGRNEEEVLDELADTLARWGDGVLG